MSSSTLLSSQEQFKTTSTTALSQHLNRLRIQKTSTSSSCKGKKDTSQEVEMEATAKTAETITLPQTFQVKYLGKREAGGLWGIKHTRKPVDDMVHAARSLKPTTTLPFLLLHVTEKGVEIEAQKQNLNNNFDPGPFPIEVVSYGVQDLVYTRVFAMIVVKDGQNKSSSLPQRQQQQPPAAPFDCHAFVCDSKQSARRLTFALAKAFQDFSQQNKAASSEGQKVRKANPRQFAIDLRSPEEIEQELKDMGDSEA